LLKKNVEECRDFSKTIADQMFYLQNRMGCMTNKTNSHKVAEANSTSTKMHLHGAGLSDREQIHLVHCWCCITK